MGTIKTFQQRQKAEYIYNTYFDFSSEHYMDFNIFDTLNFYGVIDDAELTELCDKFDVMRDELFARIKEFDKSKLKALN